MQDRHHQQGPGTTQHRRRLSPGNRLADSGSLMERDYTFFWQGLWQDELRQYGVGFAVRNSLVATTETPSGGSSRILALRMKTSAGVVNIISAYAPTLTSTPEAKDQFYRRHYRESQVPKLGPTGKHGLPASATSASAG